MTETPDSRKKNTVSLNDEEYLYSVFRVAPIGIGVVKDRVFQSVNEFFCNMVGYSEDELLGKSALFLYENKDEFERVGRVKYGQIAENGSGSIETRYKCKDGKIIDVLLSSTPFDLKDLSKGVTFSVLDITKRKKAEEEGKKLTLAIEQSHDAVVITDAEGNIRYVNPAFEEITGYRFSEINGKKTNTLSSGEHDQSFYQILWNTISTKQTWRGRMINRKKDGTLYFEENTISPVLDKNGEIINYIAVKRDVSELHKIEQEKNRLSEQIIHSQKVESVGRLAGGIAHDLNNLLSPILGYSELLKDDMEEEDPEYFMVDQILEACEKAKDLVHQLLAFSRKQALKFEVVDLNGIVAGFKEQLDGTIREDIQLKIIYGDNVPIIKADKSQLQQVMMNLARNSRDAMEKGGKLIIETGCSELDGAYTTFHPGTRTGLYAVLIITDTGTGISGDIQNKIFEPFFTTRGESRSGLGLAMVYGIVKQHGGNIWVYSEKEKGTSFKIYLPAVSVPEELPPEEPDSERSESCGGHILLAEDNNEVRSLCEMILGKSGFSVTSASSGEHALDLIESGKYTFDLLLTDIIMPGINGIELYKKAINIVPELKVLYMSGYTDNVLDLHFDIDEEWTFIQKPFSNRTLIERIENVLNGLKQESV